MEAIGSWSMKTFFFLQGNLASNHSLPFFTHLLCLSLIPRKLPLLLSSRKLNEWVEQSRHPEQSSPPQQSSSLEQSSLPQSELEEGSRIQTWGPCASTGPHPNTILSYNVLQTYGEYYPPGASQLGMTDSYLGIMDSYSHSQDSAAGRWGFSYFKTKFVMAKPDGLVEDVCKGVMILSLGRWAPTSGSICLQQTDNESRNPNYIECREKMGKSKHTLNESISQRNPLLEEENMNITWTI